MSRILPDSMEHAVPGNLIRMENATFRLGERIVFENTTWDIACGEHWALLGPNGGGKTTLARALCREIPLISGRIEYYFDPPDGDNAVRSRSYPVRNEIIRLSPDTPQSLFGQYGGFYQARWQSFTSGDAPLVSELIDAAGGASDPDLRPGTGTVPSGWKDAIVSRFCIGKLLNKRMVHLSNGEARKVALVRALLLRPRLLILDDPFCGLDRTARNLLRSVIEELTDAGLTRILMITHRQDEIPKQITRILSVNNLQISHEHLEAFRMPAEADQKPIRFGPVKMERKIVSNLRPPAIEAGGNDDPIIDMKNVTISYDGTPILDRINWRMLSGEHWALLGPNGAGKSTLLSLILADNPQAYANRIFLFGVRRGSGESIWEIKQRIGWVASELQSYYPDRSTCFEVVGSGFYDTIGLYRKCTPQQLAAAAEQMSTLGISHLGDRRLSDVSTGEKRLILLARALVKNPQLLVLDEPCQGLDRMSRNQFLALIETVCRPSEMSLIYVTHHTDELPASITHVMKLAGGAVRTCGRIVDR